jgi:hypothetical protein
MSKIFPPKEIAVNVWATLQGLTPKERQETVAELKRLQELEHLVATWGK